MANDLEITQRLPDSEDWYRVLAQTAFEGILIHRDGVIVEANHEAARIIGYPVERLIGSALLEFLSPEARATVGYHLATPRGAKQYPLTGQRPDGTRYRAEVRSSDVLYRGQPARLAMMHEATAPQQVEDRPRGPEQELHSLLVSMHDTLYRTDSAGRIVFISPSCRQLLHYEMEELIGSSLADLCAYRDDHQRLLSSLAAAGSRLHDFRMPLRRKDGAHIWVAASAQYRLDARGGFAGMEGEVRDISHVVECEERLQAALKAAEAASRAKGDFLAVMSHEIRTPMNGVLTMAQLLDGTRLDAEQRTLLGAITTSGRLLCTLLNDLLDLSRIEAGKLQIQSEEFELNQMLNNLQRLVEPLATGKGLSFRLRRQGVDGPLLLKGDEVRLQQILLNLLSNAVKFTEHGFVELVAEVRPAATGHQLTLVVVDSGIGISAAEQRRLFQPFEQGDASTTRRFGGTGLGLAITRELVTAMGGRISVTSEERKGSAFEVAVTLAPGGGSPSDEAEQALPGNSYEFLLVDDDAINRTAMSALLRRDGHKVTLANDGYQALEILSSAHFDFVLIDVHMPGIDGIETVRRYRSAGGAAADAKIIALTADTRNETARRCGEVGIRHMLAKPLIKRDLYRALQTPSVCYAM